VKTILYILISAVYSFGDELFQDNKIYYVCNHVALRIGKFLSLAHMQKKLSTPGLVSRVR